MPPADKSILPPSILLALGLAACPGKVSACLRYAETETVDTTTSPCLDYATDTSPCLDTDSDTDSDTDTDTDADTDSGVDSGAETGSTGASGTGDTGSRARSKASIFETIELRGLLPADVIDRLKKRGL